VRLFWSFVLAGGLLLVGYDTYEARREARLTLPQPGSAVMLCEDGSPIPPPPPPP